MTALGLFCVAGSAGWLFLAFPVSRRANREDRLLVFISMIVTAVAVANTSVGFFR